tara:strand:+ start:3658 stop:4059 length:402 start_codon:yes stop_codon:yes gene_type:complete
MPEFLSNKKKNKNPQDGPAPVGYNMGRGVLGSYDNLVLYNKECGWRKPPCDVPLYKDPVIYQGTPLPLKNEVVTMPLPHDSMFVFQKNQAHPSCCPATFSTSTGCICTTPEQRNLIGVYDGNNKNFPSNPSGL